MGFYSNRVFPLVNDLLTKQFVRHRKKVLSSASGKILEIGFGTGLSLPWYPATATQIIGLEPNIGMLKKVKAKHRFSANLKVVEGTAESLPFPDKEFDGVVSFLTLCSVTDLEAAVTEIKRVLKPDGRLFFIEHVVQPPGTLTRKLQSAIQPIWQHLACGCHLDRDTLGTLQKQGFMLEIKPIGYSGFPNFLGPIFRGIASLE